MRTKALVRTDHHTGYISTQYLLLCTLSSCLAIRDCCFILNDILEGDNSPAGQATFYRASLGWDACAGWGTPLVMPLIQALVRSVPLFPIPKATKHRKARGQAIAHSLNGLGSAS